MLLTCPNCQSGLQVPDGTSSMVRCPTCKAVFSAAAGTAPSEPEVNEKLEEEPEEQPRPITRNALALLTCPTCRSGMQVPEGTTAMVRCPACQAVFPAAAGRASTVSDIEEEPEEKPRPNTRKKIRVIDEDEEPPRKTRRQTREANKDSKSENRDFDPDETAQKPKKRRRLFDDDQLSSRDREALKQAFARAAWGCKLIWISILCFMVSMALIIGFWFEAAMTTPSPVFLVLAGVIGLMNWLVAAIGVGLCLSGPVSTGHWGYGIAAAIATGVHLLMLLVLVGHGREYSAARMGDSPVVHGGGAERWALLPTRLDSLTIYLTLILYRDQDLIPKLSIGFSIAVGIAELIRIALIMMLLSCLARASGDEELSHACTRAAGVACFGPGVLAVLMLLYVMGVIETNAQSGSFARIVFMTVQMGIYAVLAGTMMRALFAAKDVYEACEEPYQSQYLL